jgi:hypothetical protein
MSLLIDEWKREGRMRMKSEGENDREYRKVA